MADAFELADKISSLADQIVSEAGRLYTAIDDAIAEAPDMDCDRQHCDDWSCSCPEPTPLTEEAWDIGRDYLRQIRMGYKVDVTLQEVLEEMERTVRE